MRTWVVALLLVPALLAGCTDDGPDEPADETANEASTTQTSSSSTVSTTATTSGTTGPSNNQTISNQAPTANLTADGTSGAAPLTVAFGISATDPEGNAIEWHLDADGDGASDANGTEAPAMVEFTFAEAGNYTATLTVSDGELTSTASLRVNVSAPAAEPEPEPEPVRYAGTWVASPMGCALVGGTAYDGIAQGVAKPDPALAGGEYAVTISLQGGSIGVDFIIYNSSGTSIGGGAGAAGSAITGTLPEDAARIVLRACGAGSASYEMLIVPPSA